MLLDYFKSSTLVCFVKGWVYTYFFRFYLVYLAEFCLEAFLDTVPYKLS